jgi:hypothetical protein
MQARPFGRSVLGAATGRRTSTSAVSECRADRGYQTDSGRAANFETGEAAVHGCPGRFRMPGWSEGVTSLWHGDETMSRHVTISPAEAADRLAIRELVEAYALCADRRDDTAS